VEGLQYKQGTNFCRLSFWRAIADRFPEERSCLASFLAYHSAEVLSGVKPGNLVNIPDSIHPCGKNMFALWLRHGDSLLNGTGLHAMVMVKRKGSLLVYIYCRESLENLLTGSRVRNFLKKAGYGEYPDCEAVLVELERRMRHNDFPHEIGLFLGYPLKDVAGFLGWAKLPVSHQDAWKIYGDPRRSLELAACHRDCRCRMAARLHRAADPCLCLRKTNLQHTVPLPWRQAG
jgi:hypothetical protein